MLLTCHANSLSELRRCYNASGGIFILSLQSTKYGYRPLPAFITEENFEKALEFLKKHHPDKVTMLQEWYILDENDEGPSKTYVLKHLLDVNDKVFWNEVLPSLREALQGQSFDPSSPDLKVNFSVTEYEVVEVCLYPLFS